MIHNSETYFSAGIYLLKVNNRNNRRRCELYSKLTIKTPERWQWLRSGVFIVNFEHILYLVLALLLLTLSMKFPARLGSCQTYVMNLFAEVVTQLTFICSNSTIETLEKGVKYVQT